MYDMYCALYNICFFIKITEFKEFSCASNSTPHMAEVPCKPLSGVRMKKN
jgi:hypothetical protein